MAEKSTFEAKWGNFNYQENNYKGLKRSPKITLWLRDSMRWRKKLVG
jgi:hypothetical protein